MTDRETEVRCPICHRLCGHELIEEHIAAHSPVSPDRTGPLWQMLLILLIVILGWVGALAVWMTR